MTLPYIITGVSWKPNHKTAELLPSVTLRVVVDGMDGDTIGMPDLPDAGPTKYPFPETNPQINSTIHTQFKSICYYGAFL